MKTTLSVLAAAALVIAVLVTTAVSPASAPNLTNLTVTGGMYHGVWLSFTVPTDDGGTAIIGYQYQLDNGDWTDLSGSIPLSGTASMSQALPSGPVCGNQASVAVRAVTAAGPGAPSAPLTVTVACMMI